MRGNALSLCRMPRVESGAGSGEEAELSLRVLQCLALRPRHTRLAGCCHRPYLTAKSRQHVRRLVEWIPEHADKPDLRQTDPAHDPVA